MQVKGLIVLVRRFADALRDLAPIILVIAFFQVVVIQQPFPNLAGVALGVSRALVVNRDRDVIGMVTLRDLVIARITD